ncbi:membrane protein [Actibacterium mucosum KCTC 23349]|uniref:Membrane protein n=1 Tax=Actibacterium mucosum KCTC 23349 TaxID=1454373 RepID=A0A037ZHK9_9RHOB|nr:NnrU family protein [Actibacterium mucosum]KAJ55027.1 membrane protein [Actibacterium mucosum KCTC 23349]
MTLIVVGLILWWSAHLFKRVFPAARAKFGDPFKGIVAIAVVASIVAFVFGYREAEFIPVWTPPAWGQHANNLLMLIGIGLMGLGYTKSRLTGRLRHPMLTGMALWSVSHLLVRGDLAAILMFGGLGIWALVTMMIINATEPGWAISKNGTIAGDVRFVALSVAAFAAIAMAHSLLGPNPFPM